VELRIWALKIDVLLIVFASNRWPCSNIDYRDRLFQTVAFEGKPIRATQPKILVLSRQLWRRIRRFPRGLTQGPVFHDRLRRDQGDLGQCPVFTTLDLNETTNLSGPHGPVRSGLSRLGVRFVTCVASPDRLSNRGLPEADATLVGHLYWDPTDHFQQPAHQIVNLGVRLEGRPFGRSMAMSPMSSTNSTTPNTSVPRRSKAPFKRGRHRPAAPVDHRIELPLVSVPVAIRKREPMDSMGASPEEANAARFTAEGRFILGRKPACITCTRRSAPWMIPARRVAWGAAALASYLRIERRRYGMCADPSPSGFKVCPNRGVAYCGASALMDRFAPTSHSFDGRATVRWGICLWNVGRCLR